MPLSPWLLHADALVVALHIALVLAMRRRSPRRPSDSAPLVSFLRRASALLHHGCLLHIATRFCLASASPPLPLLTTVQKFRTSSIHRLAKPDA
eukprot:6185933-Pleurochrysis_carterae.AAC.4